MNAKRLTWCVMSIMLWIAGVQTAFAGWTDITPAISTQSLYSVWGTSATNVYAVGLNGTILHYDGTTWTAETSGTTNKLNAVWGVSETNIYAVGEKVILHKSGTGTAWGMDDIKDYITQEDYWSDMTLTSVRGTDATHVYAGFSTGYLFYFDGTGWTDFKPEPLFSQIVSGICPFTSSNIYLARKTSDNVHGRIDHYDGSSWSESKNDIVPSAIWGSSPDNIYAAATGGAIIRFNGSSWLGVASSATKDLNSIFASSASNIIAVGKEGTIVHDRGAGFVAENFDTNYKDLFGVWVASDGTAFAVGTEGMILKYTPDPVVTTTTTTPAGNTTTTVPGGNTTTTTPGGNTTTTIQGGSTSTIPGNVTTSIVPPGEVGADFIGSPLTGKMPLQVQFTNLSGGDIATYLWVFGDGSVSTEKNPSHIYEKKGKYSVILTVTGTDNTKTAIKTRDSYIEVKSKCFLVTSLDSSGQIETLRAMRDTNLDNFSGMLMTAVYYRNAAEMNELLNEYPDLRSDLRRLISENMDIFEGLLKGDPVTVSATVMNDTLDYLYKVKAHGSIKLQNEIDFMLLGVQNGYFLNALGIIIR